MLLLRHASAGERLPSQAANRARPLDDVGRTEAQELVATLMPHRVARVVSSPHARCVETVEPLARSLGLEIEEREELTPNAPLPAILSVLDELPESTLVCTHREVIERLFDGEVTCAKGGTWLLEGRGRNRVPRAYLPPPSSVPQPRRAGLLG